MTPDGPQPGEVGVVLALGANLGDPLSTLAAAVDQLSEAPGLRVVAVSPVASTQPVGGPDQPAYLNAVVIARTTRSPGSVLSWLMTSSRPPAASARSAGARGRWTST